MFSSDLVLCLAIISIAAMANAGLLFLLRGRPLQTEPLYDIIHIHVRLPSRFQRQASQLCDVWPIAIIVFTFLISSSERIRAALLLFMPLVAVRLVSCFMTTLPLLQVNQRPFLVQALLGGNGDLTVSGHVSYTLLCVWIIYTQYRWLGCLLALISLFLFAPITVALHRHYTSDVLFAIAAVGSVIHFDPL